MAPCPCLELLRSLPKRLAKVCGMLKDMTAAASTFHAVSYSMFSIGVRYCKSMMATCSTTP
jgi:hypothetical protein